MYSPPVKTFQRKSKGTVYFDYLAPKSSVYALGYNVFEAWAWRVSIH